ncbi:MAG: FtsQ-type POTRA domain-containing protein, partial [Chloroflexi bacterium]|nr:FtsQ-type POTRA domain-containing protein [Chloroflexota bacterium]
QFRIEGALLTAEADVRARLGVSTGTNLFTLATEPVEARLGELPTVARAEVAVALPDTLVARLVEREPILVWQVSARRYLIDVEGRLIAELGPGLELPLADRPVIVDRRAAAGTLGVGRSIEPVHFDAARRLGSLTPADLGSAAVELEVAVTDENGFVVTTGPDGWTAIFGFYTPSLRTTELIPGQVRLLRSLLAGREATVGRVVLASDTDGTYLPKPTPGPSPTSRP